MASAALAWPLGFVLIRSLAIIKAVRPSRAILGTGAAIVVLVLWPAMVFGSSASPSTAFHRGRDTPWAQEWPTYRRSVYGLPRGFFLASRRASHGGRWQARRALGSRSHNQGEPWWHRRPAEALGLSSCRSRDRAEAEQRTDAIGQKVCALARPRLLGSPLDSSLPLCYNRTNVLQRGCLHGLSSVVHRPIVAFAYLCGAPASRQHLFCGTNPFPPCLLARPWRVALAGVAGQERAMRAQPTAESPVAWLGASQSPCQRRLCWPR